MDSIRIRDRRTWFRYSELRGGDAISFLRRFENMSFSEAVEFLLSYHGGVRDHRAPPPPPQPKEAVPFTLPPPSPDNRRVFAYLNQTRCIAPQVIRGFIDAGLLYEEAKYHTWSIVMGIFDVAQGVVNQASGIIIGDTSIDLAAILPDMEARLRAMDMGPLLGLWVQSLIDRCVRQVYQAYLSDPRPENMPILGDLYDTLRAQEEKETQFIATALEIYVTGSLNVFNHRTNVDIDNRIVCYDIKELGKQLKQLGMLVIQDGEM